MTSRHSQHIEKHLNFAENRLAAQLFSPDLLGVLQNQLEVELVTKGNEAHLKGNEASVLLATAVLKKAYQRLQKDESLNQADLEGIIRRLRQNQDQTPEKDATKKQSPGYKAAFIQTPGKRIAARSENQADYINVLHDYDLVFCLGPAGTGKTYLAVAMAVKKLLEGSVERIILTRPAVEAGEQLGFLPGDLREKVDPYLRPLYDALHDMLPVSQVEKFLKNGQIEVAPLAYMRGRTLSNAYVILDEAQNTTPTQMKMFLTRLGEDASMVLTGDLTQVDLPKGVYSGFRHAISVLKNISDLKVVTLQAIDVVRHALVAKIIRAYEDCTSDICYETQNFHGNDPL